MPNLPAQVKIVEVGPRDGLQNESTPIATETKIELIKRLADSGLHYIEATSFVSPKWVPQMGDAAQVMAGIKGYGNAHYSALVPNEQGLREAIASGVKEIGVFTAATERFCQKNINCSIAESLVRYQQVIQLALSAGIKVRGYISCCLGCPYEGLVDPEVVVMIAKQLYDAGCYEISLGDTIGIGTVQRAKHLIRLVKQKLPITAIAVHFHDTYGQALTNIYGCLEEGVSVIDSAIAGLGGCPYAKGASGNVATEDGLTRLR